MMPRLLQFSHIWKDAKFSENLVIPLEKIKTSSISSAWTKKGVLS